MKRRFVLTMGLSLGLLLGLILAMSIYAQGPEEDPAKEEVIGDQGLADPPPAGLSVLYMFTGAANDDTDPDRIATVVHCTNFGANTVQTQIEFFNYGGTPVYTGTVDISSNQTWTFATQNTVVYDEDSDLNTGFLNQGSGRVLAASPNLICTAQVIDPISSLPSFLAKLALFDSNGNPIGSKEEIYLPLILKNG